MEAESTRHNHYPATVPRFFLALGPTLLICVGYIDVGKWAASVDGGSRCGSEIVFLALAFNCTAILCQYLSVRVCVVTGKNLAQICEEEYSETTCTLLGVHAELSLLASSLTLILGIAQGLNLLFGLDLVTCIFLTMADAFLLPIFVTHLDRRRAELLLMSMAGLALVLYLMTVLTSQPEMPLAISGVFPRLGSASAYTIMSLLGASIIPHNLYFHSSFVQKRMPNISIGALCHDHFFAVLFLFSGIFLVNYVMILSAANDIHSSVFTFQDLLLLMNQIFRSPMMPLVFFLILLFSSLVTALTWNLGGGVVLQHLLGINLPVWIHHMAVKVLTTVLALCCAWKSGAEGIYQILIFSQVIAAMLLPSSVIPLFRVASSRLIMGAFKISSFTEILSLSAFLGMVATNLMFIVDLLLGDSDLMSDLRWNLGTLPYILLITGSSASLISMLWLAATPLKSASVDTLSRNLDLQKPVPSQGRGEETESGGKRCVEEEEFTGDKTPLEKFVMTKLAVSVRDSHVDLPESITDFDHESLGDNSTTCTAQASNQEESASSHREEPISSYPDELKSSNREKPYNAEESGSSVELAPVVTKESVPSIGPVDTSTIETDETKSSGEKDAEVESDEHVRDEEEARGWEVEEALSGNSGLEPAPIVDSAGSFKTNSGKGDDGSNNSGSLSRLLGLGRAARRNFVSILDEFWGQLFDFHGQVTQEAKGKRFDLLLGLDQKSVSFLKPESVEPDYVPSYFTEAEKGSILLTNSRDYDSPRRSRIPSHSESSYRVQMEPSTWSSYLQSPGSHVQSPYGNALDTSERRYSSLRLPAYAENRDHQPATVHGYQLASYLSRIAQDQNMEVLSNPLVSTSLPKSSSLASVYKNQPNYSLGHNGFGSLPNSSLASPSLPLISRLQSDKSYLDNSPLVENFGSIGSSQYPKKYHSLPDISGRTISSRNASLIDKSSQWSNPIGPRPPVTRSPYDRRSSYSNSLSRPGPLAFDELSSTKLHEDIFSPSIALSSGTIWSRQPSEHWFGIAGKSRGVESVEAQEAVSRDSEAELLQSFRYCIAKVLKLEGSDWLFQQSGGLDEKLIDRVAAGENLVYEAEAREADWESMGESDPLFYGRKFASGSINNEATTRKHLLSPVPCCGDGCIWKMGLIVCFGVWCIRRILEMSLMESRPELWGKYTYVLNRLQGVVDMAFFKPRPALSPCFCLQNTMMQGKRFGSLLSQGLSPKGGKPGAGQQRTSASVLIDLIKDVEAAVSCRKGRTGTAAGDVAFPKGKENLVSVLKRYKRRLSSKSVGVHDSRPGRNASMSPVVFLAQ